ncbi:MAG: DUF2723 domain-containing protein [Bacteroidaceae bacterium]|nr:DUF2723 domain-containing protein [Bacteroidaceae bacterium]MBR3442662.1 DUF2723 domain-containing protein [Bacteroidaceae bacterium]
MKTYKIVNNVCGWLVFAIAAFTYCSTIEPTASFWDCPEFITTAEKMEVGHPPGAPFFMLFGKLFTLFASDATQIARMINMMSALLSAGCILFLFWSVTHLAKKLLAPEGTPLTAGRMVAIMASGVCGALIYTWSDTFWFSAVEGEVYASSSFFTALVFWLILKWEDQADEPHSDRWLVFIAYLVGLSIGVHLLNLLCIPAIVLVYYYKRSQEPTLRGSLLVLGVSVVIVAAVLYGIVPGVLKVAGWFELLFVNQLGMSFNTGLYLYIALLLACLVWALVETERGQNPTRQNIAFLLSIALLGMPFYGHGTSSVVIGLLLLAVVVVLLYWKREHVTPRLLNTALLCMTLITVGFSSYALIVIRSSANPPMDQNSPEDVFTLGEYLGREQYGDRPLFYGPTYASHPEIVENAQGDLVYNISKGAAVYQRKAKASDEERDEYIVANEKFDYIYPSNQCQLFPRIYSDKHKGLYEQWLGGVTGKSVPYQVPGGETQMITIPTQMDNLRFFFSYQLNFMYWRYFMWNFAGRQNDIQSGGEPEHGNWITGIAALDDARLGNQSLLPDELKENKGHNVFYCLPLILGLLGFFWQAFRGREGIQQFWVVFFLFFMTGIAIVIYLNQTPNQPRERDYAYAGSFYAFAMWCGLGIAALYEGLKRLMKGMADRRASIAAACLAAVPAVAVPLQMVSQTWDDHDRSGRYVCRDFGLDYLETVPHDGVIFTNGDNDTFPLWYNEDTEGNRTDVRVCNLSYLQTDWYIDQMKRPAFSGEGQSSPLPISWARVDYTTGQNEVTDVNPTVHFGGQPITMKNFVRNLYEQDPELAAKIWGEEPFELKNAIQRFVLKRGIPAEYQDLVRDLPSCLPSDSLYINVDKEAVRRSGMKLMANDSIPDRMWIDVATFNEYGEKASEQGRVYKSFMMMLEMLAQSNFSRPLYMSTTVGPSNYGSLYKHFLQEGIAWRITPYTYVDNRVQNTVADTDRMFDNMVNRYRYGNLSEPGLYIDETTMRMCYTQRRWFGVLIKQLLREGDKERALQAAEKCEKEMPSFNVPHDFESGSMDIVMAFVENGKLDRADKILSALDKKASQYFLYYMSQSDYYFEGAVRECYRLLTGLAGVSQTYADMAEQDSAYQKKADETEERLERMYQPFANRCASMGIRLQ